MVVLDPYRIPTLPFFGDMLRKRLVYFNVVNPGMVLICLVLRIVRDLVVEHWPKNCLAEMRIMAVKIRIADVDRG